MKQAHTDSHPKIKAIEFYSGIGGFHYGSTLFNHLIKHKSAIVNKRPTAQYYRDIPSEWLHPTPSVVYKRDSSLSRLSKSPHASPSPHSMSDSPHQIDGYPSGQHGVNKDIDPTNMSSTHSHHPQIEIVESFDINPVANRVYQYNFGRHPNNTDINGLKVEDIDKFQADLFMMSNPCQPFTKQNEVNLDDNDKRTSSFLHLMKDIIPNLVKLPKYMLFENVENFETSNTCSIVLESLQKLDYETSIFVLTPRQFGIPNQRNRFFLIAKLKSSPSTPSNLSLCNDPVSTTTPSSEITHDQSQSISPFSLPIPTTPTAKVINYHLPHLHFTPRDLVKDLLHGDEDDTQGYYSIWNNPDDHFDVLHSVSLPQELLDEQNEHNTPTHGHSNGNTHANPPSTASTTPPAPSSSPEPRPVPKTITNNDGLKPEHYSEVNPDAAKQWLPTVLPSSLSPYLVDTTDYSSHSFNSFMAFLQTRQTHTTGVDTTATTDGQDGNPTNGEYIPIKALMDVKQAELGRKLTKQEKREIRSERKSTRRVQHSIRQGDQLHRQTNHSLNPYLPQSFVLSGHTLSKRAMFCIDISTVYDVTTRCFTKGYASYFTGTGSMLQTYQPKPLTMLMKEFHPYLTQSHDQPQYKSKLSPRALAFLQNHPAMVPKELVDASDMTTPSSTPLYALTEQAPLHMRGIRYFQPREIANLHMFPPSREYFDQGHHADYDTEVDLNTNHHSSLTTPTHDEGERDVKKQRSETSYHENTSSQSSNIHHNMISTHENVLLPGPGDVTSIPPSSSSSLSSQPPTSSIPIPSQQFNTSTSYNNYQRSSNAFDQQYISSFDFPPEITAKQRFQLLGNSLNVYIVAHLLVQLIGSDDSS